MKLPTRFDTTSTCFGLKSVTIGALSVTIRSICDHMLFARCSLVKPTLSAACILALSGCGDNDACSLDGAMCTKLSYYGLFDDIATQQPAAGVTPYELETPLFSDYTTKHRFLALPPGLTATWSDRDAFDLPVGTVLVKTFSYLADRRDPSSHETKLETRLLIHGSEGWHGASYVYAGADEYLGKPPELMEEEGP